SSPFVDGGCTVTTFSCVASPWLNGRAHGRGIPVPLPEVPPSVPGRGARAGARRAGAGRRGEGQQAGPRLPVLRPPGDREDLHGPHPRQDGELREGAHAGAVWDLRAVPSHPRRLASRRGGDRRRL